MRTKLKGQCSAWARTYPGGKKRKSRLETAYARILQAGGRYPWFIGGMDFPHKAILVGLDGEADTRSAAMKAVTASVRKLIGQGHLDPPRVPWRCTEVFKFKQRQVLS